MPKLLLLADGRLVGAVEEDVELGAVLVSRGSDPGRPGRVTPDLGEHQVTGAEGLARFLGHVEL